MNYISDFNLININKNKSYILEQIYEYLINK